MRSGHHNRGGRGRRGRPPRLLLYRRRVRRALAPARSTSTTLWRPPTPTARPSSPGAPAEQAREARSRPTALRYFNACGADGGTARTTPPRRTSFRWPPRRPRRRAAQGIRRRLPHAGWHLPARLRARADLADAHIAALEALPECRGRSTWARAGRLRARVLAAVDAPPGS